LRREEVIRAHFGANDERKRGTQQRAVHSATAWRFCICICVAAAARRDRGVDILTHTSICKSVRSKCVQPVDAGEIKLDCKRAATTP
jgi:hypothetical protein